MGSEDSDKNVMGDDRKRESTSINSLVCSKSKFIVVHVPTARVVFYSARPDAM